MSETTTEQDNVEQAYAVLLRQYKRSWNDVDREFLADLIAEAIGLLGDALQPV